MSPEEFKEKWTRNKRTEKSASQEHFLDVCELLEVERPGDVDHDGSSFTFEKHVTISEGRTGFADVYKEGCFVWEYKRSLDNDEANHKNLVKAYAQAREYAAPLGNPPLLIVSDMKEIRVHTNFTNSIVETHVFKLIDINDPDVRQKLRWCFTAPKQLQSEITPEGVTTKAAMALALIAGKFRTKKYDPLRIAHFLNKIVFCLYAEDIDLLPDRVFSDILEEGRKKPEGFTPMLGDLFRAMKEGNGRFGTLTIPWFNGGLFDNDDVLPLGYLEIDDLFEAARLDWSVIEPAIFGTLFEGGLNPEKRKQMASLFDAHDVKTDTPDALPHILNNPLTDKGVGIHYTHPDMMMKIIEPVVLEPLRREWDEVKTAIAKARKKKVAAKSDSALTRAENSIRGLYDSFRTKLANFKVLDPACGSGNFLYLTLQHLKDFDLRVLNDARELELPLRDQCVGPDAVLGLEINPYAAELARVTIWIGELQWQRKNNFGINRAPILGNLPGIRNQDALINPDGREATWPDADTIVGNPPFLGAKKHLHELGENYIGRLRKTFNNRVPKGADLVAYWFEKSKNCLINRGLVAVGLVATNSIRQKSNRLVMEGIVHDTDLFTAWSDEPWVLDGAAVRVSLVCFQKPNEKNIACNLDGHKVKNIGPDLNSDNNGHSVSVLQSNLKIAFRGSEKHGDFDLPRETAAILLKLPLNVNGLPNSDVLCPYFNGTDIVQRCREVWVVDFGVNMSREDAARYEEPFRYISSVEAVRANNKVERRKKRWWEHGMPAGDMRVAIKALNRFVITPVTSKYRLFRWCYSPVLPDGSTVSFAREDDTFFGILHSRFHELWSLRQGTSLEDRPRYTPSTTFETFPFPDGLTPDMVADDYAHDPRALAVAEAAKELDGFRENWLNPPDLIKREPEVVAGYPDRILPKGSNAEKELKKRTLTNLYNTRPAWLDNAHRKLDAAVAAAYGWPDGLSDEEILSRLFDLNQQRAQSEDKG